ncbi:MAG: hypothetical protein ACXADD_19385 [Candidatus Thorarchaeota archaeon]
MAEEDEKQSQITATQISERLQKWAKEGGKGVWPSPFRREDVEELFKTIDSDELFYSNSEILNAIIHFMSSVSEGYTYVLKDTPSLSSYPLFLQLLSNTVGAPVKGSHDIELSTDHRTRWKLFVNISASPIVYREKEVQKGLANFIRNHSDHGMIDQHFLGQLGRVLYRCESDEFPDIIDAVAYSIRNSQEPGKIINQIISEWKSRTRHFEEIAGKLEKRYLLIVENPIIREAIKERILAEKFPFRRLSIRFNDLILNSSDFALAFAKKIRTMKDPSKLMFRIIHNPKYDVVLNNKEFQKAVEQSRMRIVEIIRTRKEVFGLMCNAAAFPPYASSKSIQNAITHRVDDIVKQFWWDLDYYDREVGGYEGWFEDFISHAFREYRGIEGTPDASLALIMKCPYLFDTPRVQEEYNSKESFREAVDSLREKIQEYNLKSARK